MNIYHRARNFNQRISFLCLAHFPEHTTLIRMKESYPITDLGFMPIRANLIEIASYLDRIQRHNETNDPRNVALIDAINCLSTQSTEKAKDILNHFSDPTSEPIPSTDNKAASGVWDKDGGQS